MGLTHKDLEGNLSAQDRIDIEAWIARTSSNDLWATKIFKKIGILVTSHVSNRPYLKACIESHKKLGYMICLAYDNYFDPAKEIDSNSLMVPADIMENVDLFFMPHHQVWGGVLYPYFWAIKWGATILQDFEYIYCVNGDFILEKPENFEQLFNLMGDADFMGCGPDSEKMINTAAFIAKSSAFKKIAQHFQDHFIPFEVYEKYTQDIGNAEGRFARAIQDLGLKIKTVAPPMNEQLHVKGQGTWYDLVGLRHIHGEHNYAYRYKGIPPEIEYFDERFTCDEYKTIKKYWETKDMELIKAWWAKE